MERYRFHADGAVFFTTFAVVEWLPVFVSEDACKIVVDSLNFCHRAKGIRTNAYVIMPTHMHAIFFDGNFDAKQLEKTLIDFRKFTGRQLADYCQKQMPACFTEALKKAAGDDRERRLWQPTKHPEQLDKEAFWRHGSLAIEAAAQSPCATNGSADRAGRFCCGPKRAISNSGRVCTPTFPRIVAHRACGSTRCQIAKDQRSLSTAALQTGWGSLCCTLHSKARVAIFRGRKVWNPTPR